MLFAELDYPEHYADCHDALVALLTAHFDRVESGLQGDSWIWVFEGNEKVELDTFSAMNHQLKSPQRDGQLVPKVLKVLQSQYRIQLIDPPELEAHEE